MKLFRLTRGDSIRRHEWFRRLVLVLLLAGIPLFSASQANLLRRSLPISRAITSPRQRPRLPLAPTSTKRSRSSANFKGKINSAKQLLGALQTYDKVQVLFTKHEGYLHLVCSQNRKDPACEADEKLESDVDAKTAFLAPEILAIPEDRLRAFLNEQPALAAYKFALADMRRDAPHVLPGPEQAFLDEFQPQIADWQYDLYQQIVAGISFGTVQTKSGELDVARQRSLIAVDPDAKSAKKDSNAAAPDSPASAICSLSR